MLTLRSAAIVGKSPVMMNSVVPIAKAAIARAINGKDMA